MFVPRVFLDCFWDFDQHGKKRRKKKNNLQNRNKQNCASKTQEVQLTSFMQHGPWVQDKKWTKTEKNCSPLTAYN